jgi:hypothetical protein
VSHLDLNFLSIVAHVTLQQINDQIVVTFSNNNSNVQYTISFLIVKFPGRESKSKRGFVEVENVNCEMRRISG